VNQNNLQNGSIPVLFHHLLLIVQVMKKYYIFVSISVSFKAAIKMDYWGFGDLHLRSFMAIQFSVWHF